MRTWLYWGMFWLLVAPSVGVVLSGLFNYPDYLSTRLGLTFGRLRPVHVNGVIFGVFSSSSSANAITWCRAFAACGYHGRNWAYRWPGCGIVSVVAALIALPLGANHGLEAGEFPLFAKKSRPFSLLPRRPHNS